METKNKLLVPYSQLQFLAAFDTLVNNCLCLDVGPAMFATLSGFSWHNTMENLNPYQTDLRALWQPIQRHTAVPQPDVVVIEREQRQSKITDYFKKSG